MTRLSIRHNTLLLLSLWLLDSVHGQGFVPAKQGCSMSHCDPQMSDQGNMMVPEGELEVLWADRDPVGSPWMVGCAANGKIAACTFGPLGEDPFLKAYNGDGDVLWSYKDLGPLASVSAPMIDEQGRVIACDARNIVMLDSDGTLLWKTELPGGVPISPVVTENGLVIVATTGGWMFAVNPDTGKKIGALQFTDTINWKKGVFGTRNTPTVQGNRIYTVNEFVPNDGIDRSRTGRVFAVDVTANSDKPFKLVWTLDFGARSGGSPTLVDGILFFDGDNPAPRAKRGEVNPHFFGVEDMGSYGQYIFKTPITGKVRASPAADPFGRGIWFSAEGSPFTLLNMQGKYVETIDVKDYAPVIGTTHKASIATFGWSPTTGNPVVMFTTADWDLEKFYHVGIDIVTKELVYWVKTGDGAKSWSTCQAATVLDSREEPVVIIITATDGVVAHGRRYS